MKCSDNLLTESYNQTPVYPGQLSLDIDKYRHHVEHFDISEEQQVALLQALWSIMRGFVELGFGVDSIQHFIPELKEFSSVADSDALDQKDNDESKDEE